MAQQPDYDVLVKLLIIGDQAVGKTSMLLRFSERTFVPNVLETIVCAVTLGSAFCSRPNKYA